MVCVLPASAPWSPGSCQMAVTGRKLCGVGRRIFRSVTPLLTMSREEVTKASGSSRSLLREILATLKSFGVFLPLPGTAADSQSVPREWTAMTEISFRFQLSKVINALAYFASHGVRDLTKLKAAKLLYYVDKYHLLKYARPVIGDRYVCMDFGPVPSNSLDFLNNAVGREVEYGPKFEPVRELFERTVKIKAGKNPVFAAASEPDMSVFSASDIEALDHVIKEYGEYEAGELVELTHADATWRIPDAVRQAGGTEPIPYQLFFDGADEGLLQFVESEQEDRDFMLALQRL